MLVAFHLIRRLYTESVSVRSELSHSHKGDLITCRDRPLNGYSRDL